MTMFIVLYSVVITARLLREFTWFIRWMQTERQAAVNPQTKSVMTCSVSLPSTHHQCRHKEIVCIVCIVCGSSDGAFCYGCCWWWYDMYHRWWCIVACWCQHWFEYFPNPPINVLSLVENVLAFHDKELLHHFVRHGVTSQVGRVDLLTVMLRICSAGSVVKPETMFD